MTNDLLSKRLSKWEANLREAHSENVVEARSDSQKVGHLAEGIWVRVAKEILPPSYRFLIRRYMKNEVDVVILPPSAPKFYDEADAIEIPPDVASAVIHVKNTLNKAELRDAMVRVHAVNDGRCNWRPTAQLERERLPSAIVALGSEWVGGFNSAHKAFWDLVKDELGATHPSQIPGFTGTPDWDIGCMSFEIRGGVDPNFPQGAVFKSVASQSSGRPIHAFAQWLYTACAASDPSLEPMRVALTQLFSLTGAGHMLPFETSAVYSDSRLGR